MKRLNLNETWRLCLSMWPDVVKAIIKDGRRTVDSAKRNWTKERGYEEVLSDCFFCEYDSQKESSGNCEDCPAKLVDPDFDCRNDEYSYYERPEFFLAKIVSLHKIYLKKARK